jgi:hypothetical protein
MLVRAERSGVPFGAARRGACGPSGPVCEPASMVVGREAPPELVLDGGAVWGTAVKVIVRERRSEITLGVAVALVWCVF